ncbi:ABC transporter permease [Streptomyces sp. NPDC057623]|uniref:ABC transporter permease n=1 Tax=Streptomyces sp. NPDC057623 TaxID=3346187 RepID=UPI0036C04F34
MSRVLANGVPLLIVVVWYFAAQNQPEYLLPAPLEVAKSLKEMLIGNLADQTFISMVRIVLAVVIAMAIGAVLTLIAHLLPVVDGLFGSRLLPFVNAVPSVGWAILGVIWLGVSDGAVVFVVVLILLPFSMVTLREGLRAIDPELREMGRSFTRRRYLVALKVELPLLFPYALAAARLSFSVGWKVAIIAEFFGAERGLGLVMNQARQNFQTETVFASILAVVTIVFVVDHLVFDPLGRLASRRSGTLVEERNN